MNIFNKFNKIYIYSPSRHPDLFHKLIKSVDNYIPNHIIPNILNEEGIDIVIEEIVNDKNFENSDCERETYESIEELKFPQDYDNGGIKILYHLDGKKMNNPRIQVMFK